jgi:hypothetical protein
MDAQVDVSNLACLIGVSLDVAWQSVHQVPLQLRDAISHRFYHSEHHTHHVNRCTTTLDESEVQAVRRFGICETIRVHRHYGVRGGVLFSDAQAAHFCHHSLESGLPLTIVEAIYVGVNSKYPVATTAIYPLWMQFVVSCSGFTDGAIADTSIFLNRQSAPS